MLTRTRRRRLIAVPLVILFLAAMAVFIAGGQDLKSRSNRITVGMPRKELQDILGPPRLTLPRTAGRGTCLCWVDQFWQVTVFTGPDGRTQSVEIIPSDSPYRRTLGRLIGLP